MLELWGVCMLKLRRKTSFKEHVSSRLTITHCAYCNSRRVFLQESRQLVNLVRLFVYLHESTTYHESSEYADGEQPRYYTTLGISKQPI